MAYQDHSPEIAGHVTDRARPMARLGRAFRMVTNDAPIVSIVAALLFGTLSIAAIAAGTIGVLLFFAMMTGMALGAAFLISLQTRELASVQRLGRYGQGEGSSPEALEDLKWEVQEREARYRDLLDHQDDVILRRDSDAGSPSSTIPIVGSSA
ncbi:hypothetical protein A7A08_01072 [Methyloligella halotolerans]|uniref:Uncharacterized protein n=1 Tax=Methyloligella halotolerans TaxID=1177755 RepID=A0A1E2S0Q8_9HYPH|nr:hypothetical protein [Methyloligella halotolerans]ODA67905.1 hypothetical protein A7A08_01072 [Methyloligella halotolerans]